MRLHTLDADDFLLGPPIDQVCELEVDSVAVPGIAEGDAVELRYATGEVASFIVAAPLTWADETYTVLRVPLAEQPEPPQ
jgi:hypothetical protein